MDTKLTIKSETRVWLCPTDTIYGFSARANDTEAIDRIKQIKGGREGMHFIVLISDFAQLEGLGVSITNRQKNFLDTIWPGPVTVIFTKDSGGTIAVRLPDYEALRNLIREVGPIISTSANRHGEQPVTTVTEAKNIFGNEVDEYIDAGVLVGEASTIVKLVR